MPNRRRCLAIDEARKPLGIVDKASLQYSLLPVSVVVFLPSVSPEIEEERRKGRTLSTKVKMNLIDLQNVSSLTALSPLDK